MFACKICNKVFARKSNLEYHTINNICGDKKIICSYCGQRYSNRPNLSRHYKTCAIKNKENAINKDDNPIMDANIINKLLDENKKLKHEFEALKLEQKRELKNITSKIKKLKTTKSINNTMTDNSTNKTINNTFVLVGCGHEDFSKIDKNEVLKVLKTGYFSTVNLTELINFNPKYPEYHNVYIPNMKDKYAMKYNGYTWELVDKSELVDSIYNTKKDFIEENLDEFVNSLTNSQKNALERWMENDEDDKKIKSVKEKIKLLLYNKKDLVIETKKNM
jgi:hypothetical protein